MRSQDQSSHHWNSSLSAVKNLVEAAALFFFFQRANKIPCPRAHRARTTYVPKKNDPSLISTSLSGPKHVRAFLAGGNLLTTASKNSLARSKLVRVAALLFSRVRVFTWSRVFQEQAATSHQIEYTIKKNTPL